MKLALAMMHGDNVIEPLSLEAIILILNIHRGIQVFSVNGVKPLLDRGLVVISKGAAEPTEAGRIFIETIRAASTVDFIG